MCYLFRQAEILILLIVVTSWVYIATESGRPFNGFKVNFIVYFEMLHIYEKKHIIIC